MFASGSDSAQFAGAILAFERRELVKAQQTLDTLLSSGGVKPDAAALRLMATRHSVFYSPLLATFAAGFLRDEGLDARYRVVPPRRTLPGTRCSAVSASRTRAR